MNCDVSEATEGLKNEQSSFSNLSVTSPTSELILQPFRRFTYVTAHSATLPSLYLHHSSFSNPSVASRTSQFILKPFFRFCYVPFPSLHLRHNSFSNLSVALPTSQVILQPFRCFTLSQLILQPFRHFTYVTTHSPSLPSLYLRHSSFSKPSVASPTSQFILKPFFRLQNEQSS